MLSVQSAPPPQTGGRDPFADHNNVPTQFAGESDGSTVAVLTEFLGFGDALGTARVMIDADATTGTDGDTGSGGRRVAGCVFVAWTRRRQTTGPPASMSRGPPAT